MNIYLAGKVSKHCWRNSLVKGFHGALEYHQCCPDENFPKAWPILENALPGGHDYTGPYFVSCDHGCYHGPNQHGLSDQWSIEVSRKRTYSLCMHAIQRSHAVFAWIESEDCYGTLCELGYARARGKLICVASGETPIPNLWFAREMADHNLIRPTVQEAFSDFLMLVHRVKSVA